MSLSGDALKSLALQASLSPQEEMLETSQKNQNLYIGIPKETELQEQRVALVPESVSLLVANGHRVVVETGAGENANFSDSDYSESGAEIIYDTKQIYKADIILKVSPPNDKEIALMKHKQILFSALQITAQPENALKKLMSKKLFMGITVSGVLLMIVGVMFADKLAPMLEKIPGVGALMDKVSGTKEEEIV